MSGYKVYKYTNKINGKVYIGQTRQSIKDRAQGKGWGYKKCPHFFSAIKHYGWENFTCEVLHDGLDRSEADALEKSYISYYRDTLNLSYNIEDGGKSKGEHRNSDEIKISISISMNGKNTGNKNGMYGKPSPNRIEVLEYDIDLNHINSFKSIRDAATYIKISTQTLSKIIKNNPVEISGKIYSVIELHKGTKYIINKYNIPKSILVYQYNLDHELLHTYENTKKAIDTGLISEHIINKIKNNPYIHNDFIWMRSDSKIKDLNAASSKKEDIIKYKDKYPQYMGYNLSVYDSMGNFFKNFESMHLLSTDIDISMGMIRKIHNHPVLTDNYIIIKNPGYIMDPPDILSFTINNLDIINNIKPIIVFDIQGNVISIYKSINIFKHIYKISADTIRKYLFKGPVKYKNIIFTDFYNLHPIGNINSRSVNNILK